MSEEPLSNEQALSFELASYRADLHRFLKVLRSWLMVIVAVILAALIFFVAYVSAAGLAAIRENTRVLKDVALVSERNRQVLQQVEAGLEASVLRLEVMKRQLAGIEVRVAPATTQKRGR